MNSRDDGGSAFPQAIQLGDRVKVDGGLTALDYFAAKAMNGMLSVQLSVGVPRVELNFDDIAEASYAMAKAMLAERKKLRTIKGDHHA